MRSFVISYTPDFEQDVDVELSKYTYDSTKERLWDGIFKAIEFLRTNAHSIGTSSYAYLNKKKIKYVHVENYLLFYKIIEHNVYLLGFIYGSSMFVDKLKKRVDR